MKINVWASKKKHIRRTSDLLHVTVLENMNDKMLPMSYIILIPQFQWNQLPALN